MAADRTPSVRRDAAGRLTGELDRHGAPVSELRWSPDHRLETAAVKIPDASWVTVEPGAAAPGPWGASDALHYDGRPLTRFGALDWARIDRIPPLAEPARLPPGAGTAVLNLVARLAADQGTATLRYEGPYPTEQLFLALLESFRWEGSAIGDPLAAFVSGGLAWTPAPHARSFEPGDVYVQRRERIEKLVVGGRAFYRPDWQGVRRHTLRVVRDAGDTTRASLQALGVVLEDLLVLGDDGTVLERPQAACDHPQVRTLPAALARGLVAVVVAGSAPALGSFIRESAASAGLEWGPVDGDFIEIGRGRLRLSPRLLLALRTVLDHAASRGERVGLGLAALREAADLVGDELRRQAQARLAAADAATQAAALARPAGGETGDAAAIGAAVEALLDAADQLA